MSEEKRMNQGYEIIDCRTIGSSEFVVGHNPKAPEPYVCWVCKKGKDYYWGIYRSTLSRAQTEMNIRYHEEEQYLCGTHQMQQRIHDSRECKKEL